MSENFHYVTETGTVMTPAEYRRWKMFTEREAAKLEDTVEYTLPFTQDVINSHSDCDCFSMGVHNCPVHKEYLKY